MTRQKYKKWRRKTWKQFKKRNIRIQRTTLTKLQTKINNARRGLNERKNRVREWTFEEVAKIVCYAIGRKCIYCRKLIHWKKYALDHKKPVERGGNNSKKNIQVICKTCNRGKGIVSHKRFKQFLKLLDSWPAVERNDLLVRTRFGGSFHSQH